MEASDSPFTYRAPECSYWRFRSPEAWPTEVRADTNLAQEKVLLTSLEALYHFLR